MLLGVLLWFEYLQVVNKMIQVIVCGEYFVCVGDCVVCYFMLGGKEFVGGCVMLMFFGDMFVFNIMFDEEIGIGVWIFDEFYWMMYIGVLCDGMLFYLVMFFVFYSKVMCEDFDVIYSYLMLVLLVKQYNWLYELCFFFNNCELLVGWCILYFCEGEYWFDLQQLVQWNCGVYFVQGLGYCVMCYMQVNVFGGFSQVKEFEGGMIFNQNWYVFLLMFNCEVGLGDWSIVDIKDLLQIGVFYCSMVYGLMVEVIYNSL